MDSIAKAHFAHFSGHDAFKLAGYPTNTTELASYYEWLRGIVGPDLLGVTETCTRLMESYRASKHRPCLEQEIEIAALIWEAYGRTSVLGFVNHADKVVSRTVTLEFRHDQ